MTFLVSAIRANGTPQRLTRLGADPKWHPLNYKESEVVSLPPGVQKIRIEVKWRQHVGFTEFTELLRIGKARVERDIEVREGISSPAVIVISDTGEVALDLDYHQPPPLPSQSPMTIEIPFDAASPNSWGLGGIAPRESLDEKVCDHVSIRKLAVLPQRAVRGTVVVKVMFTLYNRPGHDKLVDLTFAIIREGELLGKEAILRGIELEETRSVDKSVTFSLPEETLRIEPLPIMRITMSVIDD
jgi:hypothetical protein